MESFESSMAELLEVDSVREEEVLEEFDAWDSLTALSVIAFIDENYKVPVSAKELREAKTIGGLKSLVMSKHTN